MNEFEFITEILSPLAPHNALTNDAFVYQDNTVITKDIITEGVHFLQGTKPNEIAKKALRVNLSDIASMGASPYGYFLGLAINNTSRNWLESFAQGLKEDNEEFNIQLLGGDTTNLTGANLISITMLGTIEKGKAMTRSGAKIGDSVYVSGTVGDAALGLVSYSDSMLKDFITLQESYKFPRPQVKLGKKLTGLASSCIDISDGLLQDAEHICKSSAVGMEISIQKIPLSQEVKKIIAINQKYLEIVLTGGDDYQLLFTAKQDLKMNNVTEIGKAVPGKEVKIIDSKTNFSSRGYQHF